MASRPTTNNQAGDTADQYNRFTNEIKNHFDLSTTKLAAEVTRNFENLLQSVRKEVSINAASIDQMRDELVQVDRGAKDEAKKLRERMDEKVVELRTMITEQKCSGGKNTMATEHRTKEEVESNWVVYCGRAGRLRPGISRVWSL